MNRLLLPLLALLCVPNVTYAARPTFFHYYTIPVNSSEAMSGTAYGGGAIERIAVNAAKAAADTLSENITGKLDEILDDGIVIRSGKAHRISQVSSPEKSAEAPKEAPKAESDESDDDIVEFTECDDSHCYGRFRITRKVFNKLTPGPDRHFKIAQITKVKSVLVNKPQAVTVVHSSAYACDPYSGMTTRFTSNNYQSYTTTTYKRVGFFSRLFGGWRRSR